MSVASSERRGDRRPAALAAIALLLLLGACRSLPSLRAELPDGFLRLTSDPDQFKAVTADDAILWVREFADPEAGELRFWTDALRRDLVERRGYEPVGEVGSITDGAGRGGSLQQFRTRSGGEAHGYLVAVFVIGSGASQRIRTAEFVATTGTFEEHVAAVRAALQTLAP